MPQSFTANTLPALILASALAYAATTTYAEAILATNPTPVVPGTQFNGGNICFPTAGLCAAGGIVTELSVISNTFTLAGEDIVTNIDETATLTTLGGSIVGPVALTGTFEQIIVGRTFSTETGSWTTEVTSLALSGPVQGDTLSAAVDPSSTSGGNLSIMPTTLPSGGSGFQINSFFDVFADLSLDSTLPLHTTREITLTQAISAQPAPEPGGLAILGLGLLGSAALRRRRQSTGLPHPTAA